MDITEKKANLVIIFLEPIRCKLIKNDTTMEQKNQVYYLGTRLIEQD